MHIIGAGGERAESPPSAQTVTLGVVVLATTLVSLAVTWPWCARVPAGAP